MEIRKIEIASDDFAGWFAAQDAASKHDLPSGPWWNERELRVVYESTDFHDVTLWVADDGGVTVGAAVLDLPLKDNPRLGQLNVSARPDTRRRGVGTALLRELEKSAADHGRSSLLGSMNGVLGTDATPGTAFAEHHGFTRRITEVRRVQRPPFQLGRLGELEREALRHASDYQLVSWRDRVPDEHIEEYARLAGRMSTDAPLGELDYEPEAWDAARVRVSEERRARMGRDMWQTVALAPDGTMAGMTDISLAVDDDRWAYQGDTIVDPPHRGHRLGLLLKIANLRALMADRPDVKAIWTWNAESNRHMIAVNEQLGYVKAGWEAMYQRD